MILPGQVQAVRHSSQVINQSLLQEESNDIVHAIVLGLGCGTAVEAGGGGAGLHDSTDDTHHCLKPEERSLTPLSCENSSILGHFITNSPQRTLLCPLCFLLEVTTNS